MASITDCNTSTLTLMLALLSSGCTSEKSAPISPLAHPGALSPVPIEKVGLGTPIKIHACDNCPEVPAIPENIQVTPSLKTHLFEGALKVFCIGSSREGDTYSITMHVNGNDIEIGDLLHLPSDDQPGRDRALIEALETHALKSPFTISLTEDLLFVIDSIRSPFAYAHLALGKATFQLYEPTEKSPKMQAACEYPDFRGAPVIHYFTPINLASLRIDREDQMFSLAARDYDLCNRNDFILRSDTLPASDPRLKHFLQICYDGFYNKETSVLSDSHGEPLVACLEIPSLSACVQPTTGHALGAVLAGFLNYLNYLPSPELERKLGEYLLEEEVKILVTANSADLLCAEYVRSSEEISKVLESLGSARIDLQRNGKLYARVKNGSVDQYIKVLGASVDSEDDLKRVLTTFKPHIVVTVCQGISVSDDQELPEFKLLRAPLDDKDLPAAPADSANDIMQMSNNVAVIRALKHSGGRKLGDILVPNSAGGNESYDRLRKY